LQHQQDSTSFGGAYAGCHTCDGRQMAFRLGKISRRANQRDFAQFLLIFPSAELKPCAGVSPPSHNGHVIGLIDVEIPRYRTSSFNVSTSTYSSTTTFASLPPPILLN